MKRKPNHKPKRLPPTLKSKMIFSYTALLLLTIMVIGVIVNTLIDKSFERYALDRQKQQIAAITAQVEQQYDPVTGLYDIEGLEVIGSAALQNGFIIHIKNVTNEIHWDIQRHKAAECLLAIQHAETNMHSRYPHFQGGYTETTVELNYAGVITGSLIIGYYGPYSLDDNELALIALINKLLLIIAVVFITIAAVVAALETGRITGPITAAIGVTRHIAEGAYIPAPQIRAGVRACSHKRK